ncbi:MAG: nucleoside triphosphate pyrophosphohydrolase [Candidatus Neomarinimicrobiota bacterium]|nr:MAG: nucleoside triphosphate pyrophosphohydrolase [Candidatus Neomarinimicrobiota bacterium]
MGELVTIVKKLRSPNGCEWDKQQTSETLIPYLLEEAYEVAESIMDNSSSHLKEELGDLLLHVVFQAVLAEEKDEFSMNDVIVSINKKLIQRHPHVFDKNLLSKDVESIKKNWELNKKNEKNRDSILDGIPKSVPSLMPSERLQDKAASVGFEWENYQDVINKIYEELEELKLGIKDNNQKNIEEELGDILIGVVNLSRFLNVSAEVAMQKANKKFYKRFTTMEKFITKDKKEIDKLSLSELDSYWKKVKDEE